MRANSLTGQLVSFVVSLLILAAGGIGFWWLVDKPEQAASATPPPPAPLVNVAEVESHDGGLDISVDGVVVPFREIEVAAEVAGKIVFKDEACNGGRFVKKGTLLIQIDPRDYELEIQRLENEYDQAEANLQELAVQISNTSELLKLAEDQVEIEVKEVARLAGLVDTGVITDSALDRAKQVELTARNAMVQANNELQLLKTRQKRLQSAKQLVATQQERAQLDLERTKIFAAVDGVVVQDLIEENSFVQKGTPLFTIEDTSAMEVKCRLRMDELHWLWRQRTSRPSAQSDVVEGDYQIPRTPVTIGFQIAGDEQVRYEWSGVLARYEGIGLDETTRTVPCRVVVSEPRQVKLVGDDRASRPPALVRGMFVSVTLHLDHPGTLVFVPERAVRPGKAVWVIRDERVVNVALRKILDRKERMDDQGARHEYLLVEAVGDSLQRGDRVIVPPYGTLRDGDKVRVSEMP